MKKVFLKISQNSEKNTYTTQNQWLTCKGSLGRSKAKIGGNVSRDKQLYSKVPFEKLKKQPGEVQIDKYHSSPEVLKEI